MVGLSDARSLPLTFAFADFPSSATLRFLDGLYIFHEYSIRDCIEGLTCELCAERFFVPLTAMGLNAQRA